MLPYLPWQAMELFFRKYFWTVNLLFILAAAFLAAKLVNLFVESALTPMPTGTAKQHGSHPPTSERAAPQLDVERLAKLTGIPLPALEPEVKEPEQPTVDLNAPARKERAPREAPGHAAGF